eukprot:TRINITY_DN14244_c0_g1_i1.p1 TRINITY_DN14244_c0_g1~~TRINITY_DN14244_c0_g1_i1.p1  ORF type:complete len:771 (-),score=29.81 TRINITY_DN14244_c0_g1_i1:543-2855(-)
MEAHPRTSVHTPWRWVSSAFIVVLWAVLCFGGSTGFRRRDARKDDASEDAPGAVAESCCQESWEYEGKSYTKCANTDYGPAWCVVNEKCAKKHFLGGWAYCHADGALSEKPSGCTCRPQWKFKGQEYMGCARADVDEPRWCYVNENCLGSVESTEKEAEGYKWAYCSAAKADCCQEQWVFNGKAYRQCANTGQGYPWCYVKSSSCPGATPIAHGDVYWAYCHLDMSTGPTESDCSCKASWKLGTDTYDGCAQTDAGAPWCYVEDNGCEGAKKSALDKSLAFAYCKKTEVSCCDSSWTYFGKTYSGCAHTDTNHPWCRVTHPQCESKFSIAQYGDLWAYCFADGTTGLEPGDCACVMDTLTYNGKKYTGCESTDDVPTRWCYVESRSCKGSVRADNDSYHDWAYCALSATPCCDKQWTHRGRSYTGCSETGWSSPWCPVSKEGCPHALDTELRDWAYCHADQTTTAEETDCECDSECKKEDEGPARCYVKDKMCTGAKLEHGTDKAWAYCTPKCACLPHWDFNGKSYAGCSKTDIRDPWCFVNDECTIGVEADSPKASSKKWAYCFADGSFSTEKSDCTCADLWTLNSTKYRGCGAFADSPSWCIVTDPNCKGARPAGDSFQNFGIIPGPWSYCGNPHVHCCKKEWTYLGKKYNGCHRFDDEWGAWCAVESPNCPGAMVFDDSTAVTGQKYDKSEYWAYCYVNGETSPQPSQCQCDDKCTDGFCYQHANCLGARASQLTPGLYYSLCPAKKIGAAEEPVAEHAVAARNGCS